MDEVSEVIKSGAANHVAELVKKLAGPAFEEFGAMLGDSVRVYRVKNLLRTTEKTKRILEDAGLPAQPIPSRLLLPIIETCSLEDDDDLQERWAGLLATASQESSTVSVAFVETLKQLSADEAKYLEAVMKLLVVC